MPFITISFSVKALYVIGVVSSKSKNSFCFSNDQCYNPNPFQLFSHKNSNQNHTLTNANCDIDKATLPLAAPSIAGGLNHNVHRQTNQYPLSQLCLFLKPLNLYLASWHHVRIDLGNLSSHSPYTESDDILIGECSDIPVTHTGSTSLTSTYHHFHLSDVLYVPNMKKRTWFPLLGFVKTIMCYGFTFFFLFEGLSNGYNPSPIED